MMFLLTLLAPLYASTTQPSLAPTVLSGPRAIPTYQTWPGEGYYQYYSDNGFLEWTRFWTYDQCVTECEAQGSDCWGFQTINGFCDSLISREPPSDAPRYDTSNGNGPRVGVVYRKITQIWDQELERCMGLTFDWSQAAPEECQMACAIDDQCQVYQWYWNTLENEAGVGECFLDKGGNTYDCSDSHAFEGFEVVEGYRKQIVDWVANEKECLGLSWDRNVLSAAACQESCGLDVDCEVWMWFDDSATCWTGSADDCTGSRTPSASALKKLGPSSTITSEPTATADSSSSSYVTVEPTASPADSIRRVVRRKL